MSETDERKKQNEERNWIENQKEEFENWPKSRNLLGNVKRIIFWSKAIAELPILSFYLQVKFFGRLFSWRTCAAICSHTKWQLWKNHERKKMYLSIDEIPLVGMENHCKFISQIGSYFRFNFFFTGKYIFPLAAHNKVNDVMPQ